MLRTKYIFTWALITCLLPAIQVCAPEEISPNDERVIDPAVSTLFDTVWILIDYKNNWLPANLRNKACIKFASGSGDIHFASGNSFVNGYSGNFKFDEEKKLVTLVDNMISTLMGGRPEENAAEIAYLENLTNVKSYELAGDYLTLYFDNMEVGYFMRGK